MQTFTKKRIALAVGAALTASAGGAFASVAMRVHGDLAINNGFSEANKQSIYSATGLSGVMKVRLFMTSSDSTKNTVFADSTAAAVPRFGDSTKSGEIYVHSIDSAGTKRTLIDSTGSAANFTLNTSGVAGMTGATLTLPNAAAPKAFRVDSTGALLYTTDNTVTTPAWETVKVQIFANDTSVDSVIRAWCTDVDANGFCDTTADSSALGAVAAATVEAGHSLIPVTTATTADANGDGLIDGWTINTYASLTSPAAGNFSIKVLAPASAAASDSILGATDSQSLGTPTVTTSGTKVTVSFSNGATQKWSKDSAASQSAAIFAAGYFNTGVTANEVPFNVDIPSGSAIAYSNAFAESTGSTANLGNNAGTDTSVGKQAVNMLARASTTDGALPVVTKAEFFAGTKVLKITFSEAIKGIDSTGVNPSQADSTSGTGIKKAVEHIAYGTSFPGVSLAADNFNLDGDIKTATVANSGGLGTLSLSNVPSDFLSQKLLISKRISTKEPDNGAGANDSILDTVGFFSAADEPLQTGGTVTINVGATSLNFAGDTSATAVLDCNSNVAFIDIKYPFTVSVDSTASVKDQFKLTVTDGANGGSVTPNVWSTFLDSTSSVTAVGANTIRIAMPNSLKRQYMNTLAVEYETTWGAKAAVLKWIDPSDTTTSKVMGGATISSVTLPFFVASGAAPIYTAEIDGTITNVGTGAKATSYLAKWLDGDVGAKYDTTGAGSFTLIGGNITDPGDKTATNLKLEVKGTDIYTLLAKSLNTDKPAPVVAYVQLTRSRDPVNAPGNVGANANIYNEAHAQIGAYTDVNKATSITATTEPVYEVLIDPVTGNISGRLQGVLRYTAKRTIAATAARGLAFLTSAGALTGTVASGVSVATAVGNTGKFRTMIGVDATPANQGNLKDAFILTVLEEPGKTAKLITSADAGATNFVPFVPNLLAPKDGRTSFTVDNSLVLTDTLNAATTWQLVGVGNLDRKATAPALFWPRLFVSLNGTDQPKSIWNDTATGDLGLTVFGNKSGVASEATSGDTLSTISFGNTASPAGFAFGFANDIGATDKLFFLTKALPATPKVTLPGGWNLVTVPSTWVTTFPAATGTTGAGITHLLKVGAGYSTPVSWVLGDTGSTPTLKAGEPVFVFTRGVVNLN